MKTCTDFEALFTANLHGDEVDSTKLPTHDKKYTQSHLFFVREMCQGSVKGTKNALLTNGIPTNAKFHFIFIYCKKRFFLVHFCRKLNLLCKVAISNSGNMETLKKI